MVNIIKIKKNNKDKIIKIRADNKLRILQLFTKVTN